MAGLCAPLCGAAQGPAGQALPAQSRFSRTLVAYDLPQVELIDMHGRRVRLESVLGGPGPVMLQFIFTTCPGVCPVLSAIFSATQQALGDDLQDVRLVSISIDPEHDTPARLRSYAEQFRAAPQWRLLTGSLEDVVRVQKAFDAYRGNKMRHRPTTYLRLAPEDRWLRLDGFPSARELVAEYRRLAGD